MLCSEQIVGNQGSLNNRHPPGSLSRKGYTVVQFWKTPLKSEQTWVVPWLCFISDEIKLSWNCCKLYFVILITSRDRNFDPNPARPWRVSSSTWQTIAELHQIKTDRLTELLFNDFQLFNFVVQQNYFLYSKFIWRHCTSSWYTSEI